MQNFGAYVRFFVTPLICTHQQAAFFFVYGFAEPPPPPNIYRLPLHVMCCTDGQIYRIRAALSLPVVATSEQDLALAMALLERWLKRQEPPVDAPSNARQHGGGTNRRSRSGSSTSSGSGDFETPLSTCSFGGLNYPDVAFDSLPLLAFADHRFPRRKRGGCSSSAEHDTDTGPSWHPGGIDGRRSKTHSDDHDKRGATASGEHGDGHVEGSPEALAAAAATAAAPTTRKMLECDEGGDDDMVSPYGQIARLFRRLCPNLGAYVAPWLDAYSGGASLAPRLNGGQLGEADGRVRVVFVSSRFGNHGTTKTLAALMRFLPRQHFEV